MTAILLDEYIRINNLYFFLVVIMLTLSCLLIVRYIAKKVTIRQKIAGVYIERRTREIQLKNEELEKNNLIKTRLISIISHDLVSPLKFIHLTSKQLIDNKDDIPHGLQEEMMMEISNSSKELELIASNILNWIKYQNEHRRLVKEEFDLHEMVNQIFNVFHGLARQKNVTFINNINKGLVLYQYMEPVKIVLYNLILNALNFTERGNITISGGETRKGILIKVRDQGVGMSHAQIKNILSEEFIVSSTTVDKRKGNGLGYLIIKDLLKLMNAKFVIKSQKNVGTMVSIFLPK